MARMFACLALIVPVFASSPSAGELARELRVTGIDRNECYRVNEASFNKEDLKIYLTSGYIAFGKPLNGTVTSAVFTSETEGGDAEVLLIPPFRSERRSLAGFTGAPNLESHFKNALFLFTDSTGQELMEQLRDREARKSDEMGALLADRWDSVLQNLSASFETRLVHDFISADQKTGFFYMGLNGTSAGSVDITYDGKSHQILVGQLTYRDGRSAYNIWTTFPGRSVRNGQTPKPDLTLDGYRIDATIAPDLSVKATTRMTLTAHHAIGRAVPLVISRNMRITQATIDGQPAEIFDPESLRSNLMLGDDNREFLLVSSSDLSTAHAHEIQVQHEGQVISKAGDRVFLVNSRGTWYPRSGLEFANYDLTFHYPKSLELVATGEMQEDTTHADTRTSRYVSGSPIRFAAFNLGDFRTVSLNQNGFHIRICANRTLEEALQPRFISPPPPPPPILRRHTVPNDPRSLSEQPLPPDPSGRLQQLARNISFALDQMTEAFGPPPIRTLTISPVPGTFGQGFPGLVYLSTLAYLDPSQRPATARSGYQNLFFSELLEAHELAHQWWGNLVVPAGYEDTWLMEALANYSAVMLLEKTRGQKAVEAVLAQYKSDLLEKTEGGATYESLGPITWGYRLEAASGADAWRIITYEKGTWIMHMLRHQLGDAQFLAMLKYICEQYRFSSLSTLQFRDAVERFAPKNRGDLKSFFDTWVYGTGIPALKLDYSIKGLKVTGTLSQSDVPEDFSADVPIEVQAGRQKSVYWIATGSDAVPFSISLKQVPSKVSLLTSDLLMIPK